MASRRKPTDPRYRRLACERLEDRRVLNASLELLRDVNSTLADTSATVSGPASFIEVGSATFFTADNGIAGRELWRFDGSGAPVLVKDIRPGALPSSPTLLTNVGGTLFFVANDGVSGAELWKSDGTAFGTVRVRDIVAGATSAAIANLTAVGQTLYFSATDAISGTELWKSDGTEAGTVRVRDIRLGATSSSPTALTNVDGTLFFQTVNEFAGIELWKSDGTEAGTTLVMGVRSGATASAPTSPFVLGGNLYFVADDLVNGAELWKTDGTLAGTALVKEVTPGPAGTTIGGALVVGDVAYFRVDVGASNFELWKSDGTETGTTFVSSGVGGFRSLDYLTNVAGVLYFSANDGASGVELWKTDGVTTARVRDILPGAGSSSPSSLRNVAGALYFAANDGASGAELWKTDGTDSGTVLVVDIQSGATGSGPTSLTAVGSQLYFTATTSPGGANLWRSDGTATGTVLVVDLFVPSNSSTPQSLTKVGDTVFFTANDGVNGVELWKTDGTPAGTALVRDIRAGSLGSSPAWLTNGDGSLYFVANNGSAGYELWKSDGSEAGTVMVRDIQPGAIGSLPPAGTVSRPFFTMVSGVLYFAADGGSAGAGTELWRSDGSEGGTTLVRDIRANGSSFPRNLANVNGQLLFTADDSVNGRELWKSDGSESGTVLIKDVRPGTSTGFSDASSTQSFTTVGGVAYFIANDGISGNDVWRSDGTGDGTHLLFDVGLISSSVQVLPLATNGTNLFFAGPTAISSTNTLWQSDGTSIGTRQVLTSTGSTLGVPASVVDVSGATYVLVSGSIWRLDGSNTGAVLIHSNAGAIEMANVDGVLYYRTNTLGLWRLEGPTSSPELLSVTASPFSPATTSPTFAAIGDRLVFTGALAVTGTEVWTTTTLDEPRVPGDLDRSTVTDEADYVVWEGAYGSFTRLAGDANGDGVVNAADYTVWRDNVGAFVDDHGDTRAVASVVAVPSSTTGLVRTASDLDYFSFTPTGRGEHRIRVDLGTIAGVSARLLASNDTQVAADVDGGAAELVWTPTGTGPFFVEVAGAGGATGSFTLVVIGDDHGDTTATATALTTTAPTTAVSLFSSGNIEKPTDRDLFRYVAGVGQVFVRVTLGALSGARLRVYGLDGATVVAADIDGGGALIPLIALGSGATYFFEVTGHNGAVGTYDLAVASDDHADSIGRATILTNTSSIRGSLLHSGDVDWFRVPWTSQVGREALFTPIAPAFPGLNVEIYAADGVTRLGGPLAGGGAFAMLPYAGDYYLRVSSTNGVVGVYSLTVSTDAAGANNSTALTITPPTLTTPRTVTQTISSPLDVDRFALSISEVQGDLRVTLTRSGLSGGVLRAFSSSGVLLASDEDGGDATIDWFNAPSGTVYFEVTGFAGATGGYSLTVARDDHGSNAARSTTLAYEATLAGRVDTDTDRDWFRFTANAGDILVSRVARGTLSGVAARVRSPGDIVLMEDEDGGDAEFTWVAVAAGTYYIEVTGFGGATGTYSVNVTRDDHGSTNASATLLTLGTSVAGRIELTTDRDWFRFNLETAGILAVTAITSLPTQVNLRVYAADGVTLLTSDLDGGAGSLEFQVEPGVYFAEVSGSSGTVGAYSIVAGFDDHGASPAASTPITASVSTPGLILGPADSDWFRIDATAGVLHWFEVVRSGITGIDVRLYAADGVTLVASDLNGGNGLVEWTPTANGPFYVAVSGNAGANGAYRVSTDRLSTDFYSFATFVNVAHTAGVALAAPGAKSSFWFVALADYTYIVAATSGSGGGQLTDSTVRVYSADGAPVAIDDNGGGSRVTFAPATTGAFYAVVGGYGGAAGSTVIDIRGDDHSNTKESATLVTLPAVRQFAISDPIDTDWFRVDVAAPGILNVQRAGLSPMRMELLGADATTLLVATSLDPALPSSASLAFASVAGTYFVRVSPLANSDISFVGQQLQFFLESEGGSATTAAPITGEAAFVGTIDVDGDVDWFTYQAIRGRADRVVLAPMSIQQLRLRVLAADGVTVIASDVNGGPAELILPNNLSGTIFLEARSFHGEPGTYRLSLFRDDLGDSPAEAALVAPGVDFLGSISHSNDVDWFRFSVTSGTRYRLSVFPNALVNSSLVLFDSDASTVIASDGDGGSASVTWVATGDATLYAAVRGLANSTGAFYLSLVEEGSGGGPQPARVLSVPGSASAVVAGPTDKDWYRFSATAGATLRFSVAPSGQFTDPRFWLYAPDGTTLLLSRSGTLDFPPVVQYSFTAAGDYYVLIDAVIGIGGSYQLSVTQVAPALVLSGVAIARDDDESPQLTEDSPLTARDEALLLLIESPVHLPEGEIEWFALADEDDDDDPQGGSVGPWLQELVATEP